MGLTPGDLVDKTVEPGVPNGEEKRRMDTHDLSKRTRKDLLGLARQYNLKGVSRLRKEELLSKLQNVVQIRPQAKTKSLPTSTQRPKQTPVSLAPGELAVPPSPVIAPNPEQHSVPQEKQSVSVLQQDVIDSKF